jgi:hypothetical protein
LTGTAIAFYTTVAAVIPVFFLALAVQASGYKESLRKAITETETVNPGNFTGITGPLRVVWASVVVIAGVGGEATAIIVLYAGTDGSSGSPWRLIALVTTLILLAGVASGPIWEYIRASFKVQKLVLAASFKRLAEILEQLQRQASTQGPAAAAEPGDSHE